MRSGDEESGGDMRVKEIREQKGKRSLETSEDRRVARACARRREEEKEKREE